MGKVLNTRMNAIDEGHLLVSESIENGGWAEYFDESNPEMWIEDDYIRAATAVVLQNERNELNKLNEAVRTQQTGGFVDQIFPLIRAAFPNLIAHELFSVQPLQQENGQITYLNFVYGTNKGSDFVKGQRAFDVMTGMPSNASNYSSETVNTEVIGAGTGGVFTFTYTLLFIPVRPGTLRFVHDHSAGTVVTDGIDSANGTITGTNIAAGTINYETGAISITFTIAPTNVTNITCTYEYQSEVSPTTPLIDVTITSTAIKAVRNALRFRYSMDGAYEASGQFGINLSQVLQSGMAAIVAAEIDRSLIAKAWAAAGTPIATFSLTAPGAISRRQHFGDVVVPINQAGSVIYEQTHRCNNGVSWMIVDANASTVIKSAEGFTPAAKPEGVVGAYKLGYINDVPVYVDRYLSYLPGAVADGNILVGYKGGNFFEAGLVYAPYRMFYFTPEYTLDDFLSRRAMASKYGSKLVNGRMFKRISIVP